jgi:hypothetical protein
VSFAAVAALADAGLPATIALLVAGVILARVVSE